MSQRYFIHVRLNLEIIEIENEIFDLRLFARNNLDCKEQTFASFCQKHPRKERVRDICNYAYGKEIEIKMSN